MANIKVDFDSEYLKIHHSYITRGPMAMYPNLYPFPLDTMENMGYKIGLPMRGEVSKHRKFLISKGKEGPGGFRS